MPVAKKDISHLKPAVGAALDVVVAIEAAKADGKYDASDVIHFVKPLMGAPKVVEEYKKVIEEIKDLDLVEMQELVAYAQEKMPSLAHKADVVIKVKAVLQLLISAKEAVEAFKGEPETPASA